MSTSASCGKKKRIRAGHRSSTTRLLSEVDTAIGASPLEDDKLSQLKLCLDEKLQTLKQLDAEIVELVPEEELEAEITGADECKERIFSALTRIDKALRRPTDPPRAPLPVTATSPPLSNKVKLPKIALPRFGGNLLEWPTFWDSYASAIHDNRDLSDVDKFNYLRSLLERTAYDAIAGLTLSSANYAEAIGILKKRFGDQQLIISKHMETLLGIEAVKSDKNLRGLRRLCDEVESHMRSLKALGVKSDSYGAMLAPILLTKLPPDVRLIVSRKTGGSEPKVDQLLKHVEEELAARERTAHNATPPPAHKQDKPTATASFANTSRFTTPSCCYCQQKHPSKDCTTVTSTTARKQILKTSGRCFNCLARGHLGRHCRSAGRCFKCKGRHHTSVCEGQDQRSAKVDQSLAQGSALNPNAPSFASTSNNFCAGSAKSVLLQTARACIYNPAAPHHSVEVRLLLDSGSQRSYLSERARRLLQLEPTGEQQLSIATFGSSQGHLRACPVVEVGMRVRVSSPLRLSLFVVPMICEPLITQPIATCVAENQHLASLDLADYSDGEASLEVDMLIGSDFYWDLVTGGVSRGIQGPVAIHTKLGWVLSGPVSAEELTHCSANLVTTHALRVDVQLGEPDGLEEQLRSFWDLESLGIVGAEKTLYDEFLNTVTVRDGRYEVSLPWKEHHKPLPDNFQLSIKRLKGLLHRLKQTPNVLQQYDGIIRDQIKQGIVELVPDTTTASNLYHYLPHHAVVRSDKTTTKLRIVYDASARVADEPSLNDCLHKGPKFNQLILDILLRFRVFKYALTADLEKAFLQVSITEGDRDVLRFLWVDDISKDCPEVRTLRFTRVVFGVAASPFLLNATLKHHLERYAATHPDTIRRLLESTYVDDIVTGADTEDDAFELYSQSKGIFCDGAFNLRKFVSNSEQLLQRINRAEQPRAPGGSHAVADDNTNCLDESYVGATLGDSHALGIEEQKVLGVRWRPGDDRLVFDVSAIVQLASTSEPTKRKVISIVGRFYDPLGFLAPVTIRFKIFFQKLCDRKIGWDEPLPNHLILEWKALVDDLCESIPLSIPRRYLTGHEGVVTSRSLCGFCDASTRAYAAVTYLVTVTEDDVEVSFVAAKTRVAPLQSQTIPRLELLSALLLARLIATVADSLNSTLPQLELRCFTDSRVALYWIQGIDKEWKPFVRNRVAEIRQKVSPERWSHCPGETNPADLPSRGLPLLELAVSRLWRCGPEWLPAAVSSRCEPETSTMPDECASEMKKTAHTLLVTDTRVCVEEVMDCQRFGTLSRLVRVTAYVLRAIQLFKRSPSTNHPYELSPTELAGAERLWLIAAQSTLPNDNCFPSWQRQFDLFQDENGLWRCGGRLANANIPYAAKHPLLLPRSHHFTALVVQDAHVRVAHDGVKETLTETRRKFWIVKGRSLVRSLIHRCVLCRRFEGAPFRAPPPPPLPDFRLKEEPPFSYTGVDFAGPLHVRSFGLTSSEKVWICLFTCLVTRAVHLDVVTDMSTETFVRCLKRFAARRGIPRKFLSDNGKTFKAAARFIKAVFKEEDVQNHLSGRGIEWIFNIEKAPWWGGAYERMVRSTKRCLRKMVGRSRLSLDELYTALTEVESIINSRPLSYISSNDLEEPLTPSHLLMGRRVLSMPDHLSLTIDPNDEDFTANPTSTQLSDRVKRLNGALNYFWSRWRDEYLLELRDAHRNANRGRVPCSSVSVGDMVVVHDASLPRGFWKLGKIKEVIPGRDGRVRGAVVRLSSGSVVLRRPIQLLYPLEVHSDSVNSATNSPGDGVKEDETTAEPEDPQLPETSEDQDSSIPADTSTMANDSPTPATRLRRAAALQARDRLMASALADAEDC